VGSIVYRIRLRRIYAFFCSLGYEKQPMRITMQAFNVIKCLNRITTKSLDLLKKDLRKKGFYITLDWKRKKNERIKCILG